MSRAWERVVTEGERRTGTGLGESRGAEEERLLGTGLGERCVGVERRNGTFPGGGRGVSGGGRRETCPVVSLSLVRGVVWLWLMRVSGLRGPDAMT